jgi:hypothetical protein
MHVWLKRVTFFLAAIPLGLVLLSACGSAKHDIVADVPIGSELSKLDRYLQRASDSSGEVTQWIPLNEAASSPRDSIKNEFGTFTTNPIGSYDTWKATDEERNRFTGEIIFYHHGSTSSDVNSFIYVKGKLKKKDWGYLPG